MPECSHKKKLLAHAVSLRFAAERLAKISVRDRRRRRSTAAADAVGGGDEETRDAFRTTRRSVRGDQAVARCFGEADRVEWLRPPLNGTGLRTSRDDPWWFADGVVVLLTAADAAARRREANAGAAAADEPGPNDGEAGPEAGLETKPLHVSTQFPDDDDDERCFRDGDASSEAESASASPLSRLDAESTRRLARQLNSPRDVFVIVEMCDGGDGRATRADALGAAARATGIDAARILCLESAFDDVPDDGPDDGGAFLGIEASDPNAARWRVAAAAWYGEWARERAAALWPAFADARATVRFWGALGGDPEMRAARKLCGGEGAGAGNGPSVAAEGPVSSASALRSAAAAANERAEAETPSSSATSTSDSASTVAAAAAAAASRSLGSFLRWAIEGRPQFGIAGAPAIAAARLKSDPAVTRRAALSAALYSYSAAEFAAGFVLSWAVPGPLAAHAAHFTNRFRVCFAVACMAGESPLDPRVAAVVLATCAGADGAATKRAAFRGPDASLFATRPAEGEPPSTDALDDASRGNVSTDRATSSSTTSGPSLIGSLTSAVRRVADGGDAIRRDAVQAMRRVYDAGGDAVRRAGHR